MRYLTKIELQRLHEAVEIARIRLQRLYGHDNRRKEGHGILEMLEWLPLILIVQHLFVECIQIVLQILEVAEGELLGVLGIALIQFLDRDLVAVGHGIDRDPKIPILALIPENNRISVHGTI